MHPVFKVKKPFYLKPGEEKLLTRSDYKARSWTYNHDVAHFVSTMQFRGYKVTVSVVKTGKPRFVVRAEKIFVIGIQIDLFDSKRF